MQRDFLKARYLQFLQLLASDAPFAAFALPDCAFALSLADACFAFALDLLFSIFAPFGGSPRRRLLSVKGSMGV